VIRLSLSSNVQQMKRETSATASGGHLTKRIMLKG
jgi:hypothetical protein